MMDINWSYDKNNIKNLFFNMARSFGISLNDVQFDQLLLYRELVLNANRVMNLTAITDPDEFLVKHFLDSLSIGLIGLSKNDPLHVIDVGTGAGFPGIALKIAFPNWNIVLFDSLKKRISFLEDVIRELELVDIRAIHGRAEDFGRDNKFREQFDLCVSRAVANISSLSEYCLPFVKVGGSFISYKSGLYEEELQKGLFAIESLGGRFEQAFDYELEVSSFVSSKEAEQVTRTLLSIKKVEPTLMKFPRKAGIPSKRPLTGSEN